MCNTMRAIAAAAVSLLFLSEFAIAQEAAPSGDPVMQLAEINQPAKNVPLRDTLVEQLNSNTVTIVSGNPNGTYLTFAYDMAAVLDDGDNLRILPIVGKGGAQNIKDVLYLRGVDMGITQSNMLRYFNETGEVGANIASRLRYVACLNIEEWHVLVRSDINSLEELRGKKVNFSDIGSGTQTSSRLIFKDLNIQVQEVNMGQADAYEALKRGEIAATLLFAGKPAGSFSKLKPDPAYKILPIPYAPALQESYLPTRLTNEDYPGMIPADKPVETLAVTAVLAVFNWPANTERYRRVAKFTEALFAKIDKFQKKPRHPKWAEVNLAASLPGWQRFGAAQEILDRRKTAAAAGAVDDSTKLKQAFDAFLASLPPQETQALTPKRREEMFAKFMEWRAGQKQP
jgi:uncharacterized protein